MLLATHTAGSPYGGWWVGLVVGFAVVVVVVAMVAVILAAASRVGDGAQAAADALDAARASFARVSGLEPVNGALEHVLEGRRATRAPAPDHPG